MEGCPYLDPRPSSPTPFLTPYNIICGRKEGGKEEVKEEGFRLRLPLFFFPD